MLLRRNLLIIMLISLLFIGSYLTLNHFIKDVYDVYYKEQLLGTVEGPEAIGSWLTAEKARLQKQYPYTTIVFNDQQVAVETRRALFPKYNEDEVKKALGKFIEPEIYGAEITINGKRVGVVKDEQTAQSILDEIQEKYMPSETPVEIASVDSKKEETGKSKLQTIDFMQQVSINRTRINPEEATEREQLLKKLDAGSETQRTYIVQSGDCVSCIADRFDVPMDILYKNNPWIKDDFINIGDTIDLSTTEPILSVRTVESRVDTLEVPYGTQYVEDPAMKKGKTELKRAGSPGIKQVTYKIEKLNGQTIKEDVVSSEMIVKPISQIVVRGTKVPPGVGTGDFAWPVKKAEVTSEYGKRWGRFHAGTDTVSENRGIFAADNGKVVLAGWNGGYGKAVIIDHNNGYQTLYAHMSSIKVKEGQIVEKGEKIGIMGTTGNSTGVHLHFEIEKDGENQNPLKYL